MRSIVFFIFGWYLALLASHAMVTSVNMVPACYNEARQLKVKADGMAVPVIANTGLYDYCSFVFTESAEISIQSDSIQSFSISPKSLVIPATVQGNSLRFKVTKPCYLIVKIDNCRELVICAEAPEVDRPSPGDNRVYNIAVSPYQADPLGTMLCSEAIQRAIDDAHSAAGGTVYVPAGVFRCANLKLRSNVSLYLAEGAVLLASGDPSDHVTRYHKNSLKMDGTWLFYTEPNSTNVHIFGRGTIDGNARVLRANGHYLDNLVVPLQCRNFSIDGVTLRDSGLWGLIPTRCVGVTIRNTKHFNENDKFFEDDAIDIIESRDVAVVHTIAIAEDDTYSTKTWDEKTDIAKEWPGDPQPLENVLFEDMVAWSRCATFKVGFGVFQAQRNITFRNGCSYRSMRAIALNHNWGTQPAENVLFENLDVEGFLPRKKSGGRWLDITTGSAAQVINTLIKDITVRNLGDSPSRLKGFSDTARINGVTFERVRVKGKTAGSLSDLNIGETNAFVSDLKIKVR